MLNKDNNDTVINNNNESLIYVAGHNDEGNLGLGHTQNIFDLTKLTFHKKIKNIYNNYFTTLIHTMDNELYVSGTNRNGQLDCINNDDSDFDLQYLTFTKKNFNKKVKLVGFFNSFHLILTEAEGTNNKVDNNTDYDNKEKLYGCGDNSFGGLGIVNTKTTYTKYELINLDNHESDRCEKGFKNTVNPNEIIEFVKNYNALHSGFLTRNGELFVSGDNRDGQLGLNSSDKAHFAFQKVKNLDPIKLVAFGRGHSVVVTVNNEVFTCGDNNCGQLGLQNVRKNNIYTKVNDLPFKEKIIQLSCGYNFTVLLTETGEIYSCGQNSSGQLGNGYGPDVLQFTKIGAPLCKELFVGGFFVFLLTFNKNLYFTGFTGNIFNGHSNVITSPSLRFTNVTSLLNCKDDEIVINNNNSDDSNANFDEENNLILNGKVNDICLTHQSAICFYFNEEKEKKRNLLTKEEYYLFNNLGRMYLNSKFTDLFFL
ncbi:hypothetical protein ABK040_014500 [Willaertia magna]